MQPWRAFWDGQHSIYVNARHRELHDRIVARDILALLPPGRSSVLDFGCGEATHAGDVAACCGRLVLCDSAPSVRGRLVQRLAGRQNVDVIAPEEAEALPGRSLDLVVVNSVLQYLSPGEFADWLAVFRRTLKPEGRLVLGDVLPRDAGALSEAGALLRFGLEGGFAAAAVGGLARTFFSDYRRLRAEVGLTRYSEAELLALLLEAGFSGRRLPRNIGHNQGRMAFEARPAGSA